MVGVQLRNSTQCHKWETLGVFPPTLVGAFIQQHRQASSSLPLPRATCFAPAAPPAQLHSGALLVEDFQILQVLPELRLVLRSASIQNSLISLLAYLLVQQQIDRAVECPVNEVFPGNL